MWIRKALRDHRKGVDSPMPTQAVSNEEFIPRPQSEPQKQVEQLIGEMSEARAKKLGIDRRAFMANTIGLATGLLAPNKIFASKGGDVDEIESWEAAPTAEKFPKSEYFIIDCQSHFTNGLAIGCFRNAEFVKNMGFQLKNDAEAPGFKKLVKEKFLEHQTAMGGL